MTTQELVERLRRRSDQQPDSILGLLMSDAASRLSEMDAENKRLREALGMFLPEADGGLVSFSEAIANARAALEQHNGEPKP